MSPPWVDFSDLTYGEKYNEIVYSDDFQYLQYLFEQQALGEVSGQEIVAWLLDLRDVLQELEALNIDTWFDGSAWYDTLLDFPWSEFDGEPYGGFPAVPLNNEEKATIYLRRQAVMIFLEAIVAFPWSFLDMGAFSPEAQLALFIEDSRPGVGGSPKLADIEFPDAVFGEQPGADPKKRPSVNQLNWQWDPNPLDNLLVAATYLLQTGAYYWQWEKEVDDPVTVPVAVHGLWDWLQWELGLGHFLYCSDDGKYLHSEHNADNQFPIIRPLIWEYALGDKFHSCYYEAASEPPHEYWTTLFETYVLPLINGEKWDGYFQIGKPVFVHGGIAFVAFWDMVNVGVTHGCGAAVTLTSAVLRGMNIPAYLVGGGFSFFDLDTAQTCPPPPKVNWENHSTLYCPLLDEVVHGDDVFWYDLPSAFLTPIPNGLMPANYRFWDRIKMQKMMGVAVDAPENQWPNLWHFYNFTRTAYLYCLTPPYSFFIQKDWLCRYANRFIEGGLVTTGCRHLVDFEYWVETGWLTPNDGTHLSVGQILDELPDWAFWNCLP